MSWAVYAMRTPGGVRRLEDMPDGYAPPSLGTADEVIERIRTAVPDADASDPRWLRLNGPDHSVEVTVGKGVQVHDVTFYIHDGSAAVGVVLDVCRQLGVTAYDTESGELLTPASKPPVPPPLEEDELPKRKWWRRKG
jgi:hypothetical protein